jgi:O-antigen ligase
MSQKIKVIRSADPMPMRWILSCLALVTLYFQTTLADPFNSPKLWILMIIAAWLAGYVLSFRKVLTSNKSIKNFYYLIIVFLSILTITTINSEVKYIAIFGETQRRNGFLQYFSLSIVIIAASIFVRVYNIKKIILVTYFIASVSVIYSLLQTTGNDFVAWNNPYNSVISTLGNPNFAAAVMAIMGVIALSSVFIPTLKFNQRIFAAGLSLFLLFAIFRSNARQGLIAYALGVGIFLVIWLWVKNKKYGYLAAASGMIFFVISVLGMLQIGPLERYLYKSSVSIRGYYWRASIEMLINHPFFGVGIDGYGYYFKEYREVNYPLTYGFQITSTNAHNTFLQFFATGGVFLGIAYLALNGYILKQAIFGIKNLTGSDRLYLSAVFAAWIAFHAQSLISIDNIGISIWGWVLGGAIIGLSVSSSALINGTEEFPQRKASTINLGRAATSGFATLIAVVLVFILYRGESNSYKATEVFNLQDPASRAYFKELQLKALNTPLNDPTYKLVAASQLLQSGFVSEGLREVDKIYEENPRNLDTLNLLALTFEQLNNTAKAIEFREKIVLLDPWNAENYLALGKIYKNQGDLTKSNAMLAKILSFASINPIGSQAKEELGSLN